MIMVMGNRTMKALRLSSLLVAAALLTIRFGACSPDRDESDGDGEADWIQDEAGDPQIDPDAADQAAEDFLEVEADPPIDGEEEDVPEEPGEDGELVPPACNFDDPRPPPPEWGIVWDPRLSGTGEDTLGGHDHDDGLGPVGWCGSGASPHWGLVEALFQSDEDNESGGNHNIYIEVLDESGDRIVGQEVVVSNGVELWSIFTEDKPPPEYAADYPMWGGNVYRVKVAGDSDLVFNMRMPNNHHVNFLLTFRRMP
jgi:hypothetical protein